MKAIRIHSRGGPERLVYEEAPKPTPGPGDALVRVFASAITKDELTWDATYQTSDGRSRLPSIPGHEFSGMVEVITPRASEVKVGESVYALASFYRDGSAAEYIAVQAADLAPKPRTLTYEQSASVPLAALTAWQALFEHAGLTGGRRVLIHGAAGGVGTFAVQLARLEGAHVIATASAKNEEFLRQLGANEIIDYRKARFEDHVRDVDVVLDTIGGDTLERSWGVLVRGGVLISIVENPSPLKAAELGIRGVFFIVKPNRNNLIEIARLIDTGRLKPVIAEVFPLDQARRAFEVGLGSHAPGKIVLRVAGEPAAVA
jgi:NADPH:quinone reductase-like Zn-dependent oxidoreductase